MNLHLTIFTEVPKKVQAYTEYEGQLFLFKQLSSEQINFLHYCL